MTNESFYSFLRFSLGIDSSFSDVLMAEEWKHLFAVANHHALLGICFSGVSKVRKALPEHTIPQKLYMKWLAIAANIQRRNEKLNNCCREIQKQLERNGNKGCVLKGQGIAQLYGESLSELRQSGDVDIWILPIANTDKNAHFSRVMSFAGSISPIKDFNHQHIAIRMFKDVDVEIHFTPSVMYCPLHNSRLQKWFATCERYMENKDGFCCPSSEFNVVYMLLHCYSHLLFEGVGLRQIMDYYFVLKKLTLQEKEKEELQEKLCYLGLAKFAGAMMWAQKEVFHLDETKMICPPNEREGRFFLNEIMYGGNFGHYGKDMVMESRASGAFAFFKARIKRNVRFLNHYPNEVLWSPLAMVMHKCWKNKAKKSLEKKYDIFYL